MGSSKNTSSLRQLKNAALILCLEAKEAGLDSRQVHHLIEEAFEVLHVNRLNRIGKVIPVRAIK